jgi:hypothetical protein
MASEAKVSADEKLEIGSEATQFSNIALGAGVLALAGGVALGWSEQESLLRSYLTAFMFTLSIGLGALWFVTVNHLTNAKWSIVVRRVAEIIAAQLPVLAVLSLGIIAPMAMVDTHGESPIQSLYAWLSDAKVHSDHLLHHKAAYLNKGFFLGRVVVYLAVWIGLSLFFYKRSVRQDSSTHEESEQIRGQLATISAPGMIAFALTVTFFAFDMLMSLDYSWFSTIFGVYYFSGCVLTFYSSMVLSLLWLQKQGRLATWVNENHYHDLGKMMFAFTVFWAYVGFAQFMLIWYGDIPEETHWFKWRFVGDWRVVSTLLLVCKFVISFFALLSRHVKRNKVALGVLAVWVMAFQYLDIYWLVFPQGQEEVDLGLRDVLLLLGMLSIFFGMAARKATGASLVPTKDARLKQSLAFENY